MADFFLKISPNIAVGSHIIARLGHIVEKHLDKTEKRWLLVLDPGMRETGIAEQAEKALAEREIEIIGFDDIPTANTTVLENVLSLARGAHVRGVLALGGVRAAAVGRAAAALYNETGDIFDYIEGAQPLSQPLPFVQVATTCRDPAMFLDKTPVVDARNNQAVLMKIQSGVCKAVVMDPNTYMHISSRMASSMLFQAAAIAFEGYISTRANFFSDTILGKALEILFLSLDPEQRKVSGIEPEMLAAQGGCMASLGASLSSPGMVTALALACNARYRAPLSLVAAILLPHLAEEVAHSSVEKAVTLAKILGVDTTGKTDGETAALAAEEIRRRLDSCGLPLRLKDAELTIEQLAVAAEDAGRMDIMNYTPRSMSSDDLFDLMKRAY